MSNSEWDFDQLQAFVGERVEGAPAPGRHACRSALRHIDRAWQIRALDPEIALFRAITGEEEAARAVFHALQRRRYSGADRLNWRSHLHKAAVIPFCAAIGRLLQSQGLFIPDVVIDSSTPPPRLRTRAIIPALSGQAIVVFPEPPLNWQLFLDQKAPTFVAELAAVAEGNDLKDIIAYIRRQANERNVALYASDQGIPTFVGSIDAHLQERRGNVLTLCTLFLLVDEHAMVQSFAQQALNAFLDVLTALDQRRTRRTHVAARGD